MEEIPQFFVVNMVFVLFSLLLFFSAIHIVVAWLFVRDLKLSIASHSRVLFRHIKLSSCDCLVCQHEFPKKQKEKIKKSPDS